MIPFSTTTEPAAGSVAATFQVSLTHTWDQDLATARAPANPTPYSPRQEIEWEGGRRATDSDGRIDGAGAAAIDGSAGAAERCSGTYLFRALRRDRAELCALERDRHHAFAARSVPVNLGSHRSAARFFQPSPELVTAINVALKVGAPLLLTGEPGTGKTQVAFYLAWYFGIEENLFSLYVRSSTVAGDLLYRFDTVAYFHRSQDPAYRDKPIDRGDFISKGPLWQAYELGQPTIVLIDEIDKAPRDFPNDLLNVLDQHEFQVPELDGKTITRDTAQPPPLVVISSNSERHLPDAFLRRTIFHHIEFTPELVRKAVQARAGAGDFPDLAPEVQEAAIERFLEIRDRRLRKKPATAELLVWLTVLSAMDGITAGTLRDRPLVKLPALAALVKNQEDWDKL